MTHKARKSSGYYLKRGDFMQSIWEEGISRREFEPLRENIRTDVLIIGGGLAGVLCAYLLKEAGVDTVLIEADRIGSGITQNTTAKITLQHGLIYDKLLKRFGYSKAQLYLEAQMGALKRYASLCRDFSCDYEEKDSFVYARRDRERLEREVDALNRLGLRAEFSEACDIPLRTVGAVRVKGQAQMHPMKLLLGLAAELPIFEKTKAVELAPHKVITTNGEIRCEKIIVATHFPILNKHGSYFLKLFQHRSYVLALEDAVLPDGMYMDEDDKGLSFRSYQNLLLLGGGAHRTGKKGGNWRELESFACKNYSGARITARWATQDCMTLDGIPYIGQYARSTRDLYVTTGFNKWGMTSAMISAMILSDLICGKKNEFSSVFAPSRSMLRLQLAVNAFESVVGLLTPTVPRCPHLGCALKYNAQEHSWDCPCHGSRFSETGELINNPATDDKQGL